MSVLDRRGVLVSIVQTEISGRKAGWKFWQAEALLLARRDYNTGVSIEDGLRRL